MPHTKLGPHCLAEPNVDETRQLLARWKPPVIKSMGDVNYLPLVADVVPEAKLVQRFWWLDGPGGPNDFDNWYAAYGENSAEKWVEKFTPDLLKQKNNYRMYMESFNEVQNNVNYLRFEARRTRILFERFGLRSAVINPGVGTTDESLWQRARDVGLLDALRDTQSLIGAHAYAGLFMALWHHTPTDNFRLPNPLTGYLFPEPFTADDPRSMDSWLAFRVRRDYESLKNLGYGDLKFVLTEFGFDNAGVETYMLYTKEPAGGWKSWVKHWQNLGFLAGKTAEQFCAEQYDWADRQLLNYDFVEGAALFTYGSRMDVTWTNYDIRNTDVMTGLLQKIEARAGTQPSSGTDTTDTDTTDTDTSDTGTSGTASGTTIIARSPADLKVSDENIHGEIFLSIHTMLTHLTALLREVGIQGGLKDTSTHSILAINLPASATAGQRTAIKEIVRYSMRLLALQNIPVEYTEYPDRYTLRIAIPMVG